MDTSGLSTSLSLAAFLAVFGYLRLAEYAAGLSGNSAAWAPEYLNCLLFTLRLLRLASVIAAVLSAQALVLSQDSSAVVLIAIVALGLLAFLVIIDRGAKHLSTRFPAAASNIALPLHASLLRLRNLAWPNGGVRIETGASVGEDHTGDGLEALKTTTMVITEDEQAGLDRRERLMIRSILRLDESTAREVMVPRVDIIAVEADTPLAEVASRMLASGHSRLPVYGETIDNIIGVVYSRDLLPFLGKVEDHLPLGKVLRPAFFIPESKRLDELLRELQEKRMQLAMVVDEYGGIEGLVTLEDLLEEIVGEIEDEFSRGLESRVVALANGDMIVDARVTLDYLSDLCATPMGNEDVDTIGGLVYSALGKMPEVGDGVVHNGLRIEVVSLLGRRIRKLKLTQGEN